MLSFIVIFLLVCTLCLGEPLVFYWGSTKILAQAKVKPYSRLQSCTGAKPEYMELYPYDGTLEGAIRNCGLACAGLRVELNNTKVCTGFRIKNLITCETFKCENPKIRRSRKKSQKQTIVLLQSHVA